MQSRSGAEVDETDVSGDQVEDDVFVLDVAMDHAGVVDEPQRLDDAPEHPPRVGLVERASLGDVVEQVDAARRPLQHEHVPVRVPVVVEQAEDAGHVVDAPQKVNLVRNALPVLLTCVTQRQQIFLSPEFARP